MLAYTLAKPRTAPPSRSAGAVPSSKPASSVARALLVIGDSWTLLILRAAFLGARRYGQWREAFTITDAVLTDRLGRLVSAGIFDRVRYCETPPRDEYRFTEAGLDLWSVLIAIWSWETRWAASGVAPVLVLAHTACDHLTIPVTVCAACRAPVHVRDVALARPHSGATDPAPTARWWRRSTVEQACRSDELLFHSTLQIFGERWSVSVMVEIFRGHRRFVDIRRELGLSPNILSDRLKMLSALGVIEQQPSASARGAAYRPTDKGRDLYSVTLFLLDWGDRWLAGGEPPPTILEHRLCGHRLRPRLACSACGELVTRRSLQWFRPG